MMVDAGHLALVIAFVATLYVVAASFIGALRRVPELSTSGRYGLYTVPVLLGVSTFALVQAFVQNDFSVRYVAENSSLSMPKAYTWVAMYAGNAGSLLFIALVLSVLTVAAVLTLRRRLPYTAPYATALMAAFLAFFLAVMLFLADPLERLPIVPQDGQGINPLLVHFGMFIHPPLQMTGLVSVTIPFSIAMGAMLARRGGRDEWVDVGRLWGMLSWLIMTAGLMLGAWWAYTILGWGGYWAWDPVENSALMPWLAMTAFVHSIMVQKRRGMFRMWNIVLIVVAFTLAQMGMFINRGGPVPSVHSFAQSAMGWIFLSFMVGTLALSMAAFVWRMDTLRSRERLDSLLSRESAFLVQNVLFLLVAFVTLWGTVFPVFSEAAQGTTVTVGRPFFDRVNGPLLLALIALMGVGPLLPWRRATPRILFAVTRVPVGAGLVTAAVLAVSGMRDPVALLAFAVCGAATAGILHEWARGTRSRHGRGEAYPCRLRPPPVGEQAALRRLHRPYRHRPAGGGRRGLLLLRRPEGHRSASGRGGLLRRLHLPIPGPRRLAPPGQAGGVRRCRAARRGPLPRRHEGVPGRLSGLQHRVDPRGDQEHADRGLLHRPVRVRGGRAGCVPGHGQPHGLVDVGVRARYSCSASSSPCRPSASRRRRLCECPSSRRPLGRSRKP